jgi:hypothetical protein
VASFAITVLIFLLALVGCFNTRKGSRYFEVVARRLVGPAASARSVRVVTLTLIFAMAALLIAVVIVVNP